MLRNMRLPCAVLMMLLAFGAAAMDLQQAKNGGLVGEQLNGYLGLVASDAPAEVKQLMKKVNTARRAKYQSIAAKNKLKIKQVETLAGGKATKKTRAGHFIQTSSGRWVKK